MTACDPPIGALVQSIFRLPSDPCEIYVYLGRRGATWNQEHVLWPLAESERVYNAAVYYHPWYLTRCIELWKVIATPSQDEATHEQD